MTMVGLDNELTYHEAGWAVDGMIHKGITIDKNQKIPSGALSTVINEVNHHWDSILIVVAMDNVGIFQPSARPSSAA